MDELTPVQFLKAQDLWKQVTYLQAENLILHTQAMQFTAEVKTLGEQLASSQGEATTLCT